MLSFWSQLYIFNEDEVKYNAFVDGAREYGVLVRVANMSPSFNIF